MTKNNDIAKRMILRRADMGMSQDELGKRSGVAPAQISRYESGKSRPRPAILSRIAEALAVPLEWLAYGENNLPPPKLKGMNAYNITLPDDIAEIVTRRAEELGIPEYEFMERILAESLIKDGLISGLDEYYNKKPT